MNLLQILGEAKGLVPPPADLTDEKLVLKINQIQRKIFRQLPLPDKVYRFSSTPGVPFYDLPTDCSEDRIKNALVDNQNYTKVSNQEESPPPFFCTVILEKLYLSPNPSTIVDVYLYYRPRYHDLNADNMNDIPDLPEDFHELLVFGCAKFIASTIRDIDMVNNMQAEYDSLFEDAKKYLKKFTPKRVLIVEKW